MHAATLLSRSAMPLRSVIGRALSCVALCMLVAGCGFHLKGATPLPFRTIYTNIPENSAFGAAMRRAIMAASPATRFVEEPGRAEARLTQLANDQRLRELSIDAQGQVEEYELDLEFVFQLTDAQGHLVLPPTTLRATRELPYDPTVVQAKQGEIATVFNEMQQSMVDRVVRRLTSPEVEEAFRDTRNLPTDDSQALPPPPAAAPVPPTPAPWNPARRGMGTGLY